MTDEEKAKENYTKVYLNGDISLNTEEKYFAYTKGYCKGYKDGLAEGKPKWQLKENAKLKKQNESLKDTLQAIATDTNEHITHNVAQNELDKWE